MEEDDSLIRDLKIATDLYSSNCNKVYDLSKERKLVRPAFARQLDVDNFRQVNSTHIISIVLLCDTGFSPVKLLNDYLKTCSMSPRMKSKIFFGLNGYTLSTSLKMWSSCVIDNKEKMICVIGCNLAGCCSVENVAILAGDLGSLFEIAGKGKIKLLRAGFQLVNNVMILYAGNMETDISKLIKVSNDKFNKYEPGNFPGAFFKALNYRDCKLVIAYTTSLFSFLGCRHPADMLETLPERVKTIKSCQTTEKVHNDSKTRQIKRVQNVTGAELVEPPKKKRKKTTT